MGTANHRLDKKVFIEPFIKSNLVNCVFFTHAEPIKPTHITVWRDIKQRN